MDTKGETIKEEKEEEKPTLNHTSIVFRFIYDFSVKKPKKKAKKKKQKTKSSNKNKRFI